MKRILDYEQMNDLLSSLDNVKKEKPIGYTNFGYPIDHYSFGHGKYNVIITGGTHGAELISNIFVIRFMEKLSKREIVVDENLYTLHFIPFVNPEGTVIVTSTIRTLIPRDMNEEEAQTICLTYYRNCHIAGDYALKYGDKSNLQFAMFKYATPDILDNEGLKNSLKKMFKENNLPNGCMINWSSNGRGVDLNSNIECGKFVDRVSGGEKIYGKLHLSSIRRDKLGPVGCPYLNKGEIEKENIALLNFYNSLPNLIGSFIYHSCGNIVYYLGGANEKNPWVNLINEDKNYEVAKVYGEVTGYKLDGLEIYTTMDSKLKSLFPVTLLIELGGVRAVPLSQFMDFNLEGSNEEFKYVYTKIIKDNIEAVIKTLPKMLEVYCKIK